MNDLKGEGKQKNWEEKENEEKKGNEKVEKKGFGYKQERLRKKKK